MRRCARNQVRLIVWGPSAKLLTRDEALKKGIGKLKEAGVELQACKGCADMFGVSDQLSELGIEVIYIGTTLTEMLKTDWKVITF